MVVLSEMQRVIATALLPVVLLVYTYGFPTGLAIAVAAWLSYFSFKQNQQSSLYKHIPGPPGYPFIGSAIDILTDNEKKCTQWAHEYGPVFKFKFIFWYFIVVADSQSLRRVMIKNESNYTKNVFVYKQIKNVAGDNILTMTDTEAHKWVRGNLAEAFSYSSLKGYFPVFIDKAKVLVDRWNADIQGGVNTIDLLEYFDLLTLDIIGPVAFASDFNSLKKGGATQRQTHGEHLHDLVAAFEKIPSVGEALFTLLLKDFSSSYKQQRAASEELFSEMSKIIQKKRDSMQTGNSSPKTHKVQKDILDILVALKDKNGEYLSHREICQQCMFLMLAGHETSSTALMWTVYLLAKYPDVQEKVAQELLENFKTKDENNSDFVDNLPYLNNVVKESMRLFPPGVLMMRKCESEDTLSGFNIPAGATILLNPYVVHNLESNWENASCFDPDRWGSLDESKSGVYIPFLLGSRNCIGNRFALLEIKAILAVLVPRFSFSLPPDHPTDLKIISLPTLRPSPRIKVVVSPRCDSLL